MAGRLLVLFRPLAAVFIAAGMGAPVPALAGDPSAFAKSVAELPPAQQLDIVRIILDDVFGSPDQIRANFAAACTRRQQQPAPAQGVPEKKPALPLTSMLRAKMAGLSKDASLAALCATPIRTKVDAALAIEGRIAKKRAATEAAEDAAFATSEQAAKAARPAKPD